MLIRQAISTKYFGPSNVNGSRVKAQAAAGSITLHWDHSLNPEQNHVQAALALAEKLKWDGCYYAGATHNSSGYVFVCVDSHFSKDNDPVFTVRNAA
jgi:hypothetical protein